MPPIRVPLSELELDRPAIHVGGDAHVFKGRWRPAGETSAVPVAIKKYLVRDGLSIRAFEREAHALTRADDRPWAHVLEALAYVSEAPNYCIVFPWCERGPCTFSNQLETTLGWCLDAVRGLRELHDANVVHRDIKASNVLVDDSYAARVIDLGSSVSLDSTSEDVSALQSGPSGGYFKKVMRGVTILYAAPEILTLVSAGTKASDVYAMGITMAQILTGETPYAKAQKENPALNTVLDATYSEQALTSAICTDGLRPPVAGLAARFRREEEGATGRALASLESLVRSMWRHDPETRPSIEEVESKLLRVIQEGDLDVSLDARRRAETEQEAPSGKRPRRTPPPPAETARLYTPASSPPLDASSALQPSFIGTNHTELPKLYAPATRPPAPLQVGAYATCGRRGPDKMEDRHALTYLRGVGETERGAMIVTILDGHGGPGTADFCISDIDQRAQASVGRADETEGYRDAFLRADDRLLSETAEESGATGLLVTIHTSGSSGVTKIVCANAGDCRAVYTEILSQENGLVRAERLTRDHLANVPAERERVRRAGGAVEKDQIGNYRVEGYCQVTRALGDRRVKPYGVVADPEISIKLVTPRASPDVLRALIVASDGLWDVMSDVEAGELIRDTVKDVGIVAKRLGTEAVAKGSGDNITVVVVFLE